jgi:hypothetical protein
MNIKEELRIVALTQEAMTDLGKKIIEEYVANEAARNSIAIIPGADNNGRWIRFNLAGWDLTVVHITAEDKLNAVMNLVVSPDSPVKSINIYNAALDLYNLVQTLQQIINAQEAANAPKEDKPTTEQPVAEVTSVKKSAKKKSTKKSK